jgi:hypothetical protein
MTHRLLAPHGQRRRHGSKPRSMRTPSSWALSEYLHPTGGLSSDAACADAEYLAGLGSTSSASTAPRPPSGSPDTALPGRCATSPPTCSIPRAVVVSLRPRGRDDHRPSEPGLGSSHWRCAPGSAWLPARSWPVGCVFRPARSATGTSASLVVESSASIHLPGIVWHLWRDGTWWLPQSAASSSVAACPASVVRRRKSASSSSWSSL